MAPNDCTAPSGTIIDELATYGVEVIYDGDFYDEIKDQELGNLLSGIERTADALEILGVSGNSRQDRFRSAFISSTVGGADLTITFLRLPPSDTSPPPNTPFGDYYSGSDFSVSVNCLMNDAEDNISETKRGYVVACRRFEGGYRWSPQPIPAPANWDDGLLTTEAVIHELGHIIDTRFSVGTNIHSDPLYDCREGSFDNPVMDSVNPVGGRIIRGLEGWGSYSESNSRAEISQFQQNPSATRIETTADMFLNWVFRITTDQNGYFNPDLVRNPPSGMNGQDYLCGYRTASIRPGTLTTFLDGDEGSLLSGLAIQLAHDTALTEWDNTLWTGFLNTDANGLLYANDQRNSQGVITDRREYLPGNARYVRTHNALKDSLSSVIP